MIRIGTLFWKHHTSGTGVSLLEIDLKVGRSARRIARLPFRPKRSIGTGQTRAAGKGRNTPALTDYFYRAVHEATVATKQLVKSYYSAPISRAYFDGCSNGGKMGFEEATRFPNDYDAIIAGAPWLDPLGTSLWALKNTKALLDAYVPPSTFAAIDAAQLAQCDKIDGVADGLIQDPASLKTRSTRSTGTSTRPA
jgi:feruloyl esterase